MNKEELKQEAYSFAKNSKDVQNFECGFDTAFKSYLAGAEPREKRIAELQEENAELRNNGFTVSAMTEQQLKVALEKGEQLEKENAELKCECRRCVYTDSPCILSDYGKDRNGICDHFKDVFDENAELRTKLEALEGQTPWKDIKDKSEVVGKLTKAKEIIKNLLFFLNKFYSEDWPVCMDEAEQFLNSEVEK